MKVTIQMELMFIVNHKYSIRINSKPKFYISMSREDMKNIINSYK